MKLSEIVKYLNLLQKTDLYEYCAPALARLADVNHVVSNHQLQIEHFTQDITANFDQVNNAMVKLQATFVDLKLKLQELVDRQEPEYYQESTRLYEQEMCNETPEYILTRRLSIDEENDTLLRSRIKILSDWRLPGLIIRPGLETFIEQMVPMDPLYILDEHRDLIAPTLVKFTREYQNRLRTYVINDRIHKEVMWQLPDSQFGFAFIYNFFNFKPIQVITYYLTELMKKLRPGGVVIFTYNECNNSQGIGLVEQNFMCYTPGPGISKIAKELGFEILFNQVGPYDISWFELKKPGEITSLRGGQTLAQILRK